MLRCQGHGPCGLMVGSVELRALVVTNMYPSPDRPALGRFVHDQVQALRALDDARGGAVRVHRRQPCRLRSCGGRAAPAARRRALRRGPRPLRTDGLARAGRARLAARAGDPARNRPRASPLAGDHAGGLAPLRPRRGGLGRARRAVPHGRCVAARCRCSRAESTWSASAPIERGAPRARPSACGPRAPACCSPPIPRATREAPRSRAGAPPATRRC